MLNNDMTNASLLLPSLQERLEPLNRKSGVSDEATQGAFGQFVVIRNCKAAVRRVTMAENNMAARLMIHNIAECLECPHCLSS